MGDIQTVGKPMLRIVRGRFVRGSMIRAGGVWRPMTSDETLLYDAEFESKHPRNDDGRFDNPDGIGEPEDDRTGDAIDAGVSNDDGENVQALIAQRRRLQLQLDAIPSPGGIPGGAVSRAHAEKTSVIRKQIAELSEKIGKRPQFWKPRPATAADRIIARKFKNTKSMAMYSAPTIYVDGFVIDGDDIFGAGAWRPITESEELTFSSSVDEDLVDHTRKFAGLNIAVENPAGSERSGVDDAGKAWSVKMKHDYGFIRRGRGEDGEGLDVFLGEDETAPDVYIVHQNNPATGKYDEDKVMLGFAFAAEAKAAYLANYDSPDFYRSMTIMPIEQFKQLLTNGEPGGAHWKRKLGREHATAAIFSAENFDAEAVGKWITIGGSPGDRGAHEGGTKVNIDPSGKINAGPKALTGRNIDDLPDRPSRGEAKPHVERVRRIHAGAEKPEPSADDEKLIEGKFRKELAEDQKIAQAEAMTSDDPVSKLKETMQKNRAMHARVKELRDSGLSIEKAVVQARKEMSGGATPGAPMEGAAPARRPDERMGPGGVPIRSVEESGKDRINDQVEADLKRRAAAGQPAEWPTGAGARDAHQIPTDKPVAAPPAKPDATIPPVGKGGGDEYPTGAPAPQKTSPAHELRRAFDDAYKSSRDRVASTAPPSPAAPSPGTPVEQLKQKMSKKKAVTGKSASNKLTEPPEPDKTLEAKPEYEDGTRRTGSMRTDVAAGNSGSKSENPRDRARLKEFGSSAVFGKEAGIRLADGSTLKAKYAVIDADGLTPSHDARENFKLNALGDINERPYHDPLEGRESRATVEKIASKPDPSLLHTDTPTPIDGPPVVSDEGIVYGGNARTMGMQLAYHRGGDNAEKLAAATHEALAKFGIDSGAAKGMKHPVLVRVVDGAHAKGELSRSLNESLTAGKSSSTDAVSRASKISNGTITRIGDMLGDGDEGQSLREIMSNPDRSARVVQDLVKDGAWNNNDLSRYTDAKTNELNDEGKMVIERSLMGRLIDDPGVLASATPAAKNRVMSALPELLRATEAEPKVRKWLFDAVAGFGDFKTSGLSAEDFYFRQATMQPPPGFGNRQVAAIVDAMDKLGPRKFRDAARGLLDGLGAGEDGRLGFAVSAKSASPEDAVRDAFAPGMPKDEPGKAEAPPDPKAEETESVKDKETSHMFSATPEQQLRQRIMFNRAITPLGLLRCQLDNFDGNAWDESKHPRGQPKNAGQFGRGHGSAGGSPGRSPLGKLKDKLFGSRKPSAPARETSRPYAELSDSTADPEAAKAKFSKQLQDQETPAADDPGAGEPDFPEQEHQGEREKFGAWWEESERGKKITPPADDADVDRFISECELTPEYKEAVSRLEKFAGETKSGNVTEWSREKYSDGAGNYNPERRKIHEAIKAKMLTPESRVKPGERPQAVILLGPPGSGKSTAGAPQADKFGVTFANVNADDVKSSLPEYEGWNAAMLHEESSDLAEGEVLPQAIRDRHHTLFDATGNNAGKMQKLADEFAKHGYDVNVINVELPPHKSVARAWERFQKNAFGQGDPNGEPGRFVPPKYCYMVGAKPTKTYEAMKESLSVKSWVSINNDVPKGAKPIVRDEGMR